MEFIQPSRLAETIPDLVFYAEPLNSLGINQKTKVDEELQQLDEYIKEFNVNELRDDSEQLPDLSMYQPQALTMNLSTTEVAKQAQAELLVATENSVNKSANSKISQLATVSEPQTYKGAMNCADAIHWKKAIEKEGKSLRDHKTWKLVPLPTGKKP